MKKLLIAATAVCMAVASQAAVANWRATAANLYDGSGSTETSAKYSGSIYIFDSAFATQESLYSLICESVAAGTSFDATAAKGYVATGTASNGSVPNSTTFAYGEQTTSEAAHSYTYYFVILDTDKAYFSAEKTVAANGTATAKAVTFGSQTNSSLAPASSSGFAGAGKWSAVPEPTSGLLLLLGFAGLALRRKQK